MKFERIAYPRDTYLEELGRYARAGAEIFYRYFKFQREILCLDRSGDPQIFVQNVDKPPLDRAEVM